MTRALLFLLLAASALSGQEAPRPARTVGPQLQERIDAAIERGVAWLKGAQRDDGRWPVETNTDSLAGIGPGLRLHGPGALTALALRALSAVGLRNDDSSIRRGVDWIRDHPDDFFGSPYNQGAVVSASTQVILALSRINPRELRPTIELHVRRLLSNRLENGGWAWVGPPTARHPPVGLVSLTNHATEALWAARRRARVAVAKEVWEGVLGLYRSQQMAGGGWNSSRSARAPHPSLTAGALAAVTVGLSLSYPAGFWDVERLRKKRIVRRGLKALRTFPDLMPIDHKELGKGPLTVEQLSDPLVWLVERDRAGRVLRLEDGLWYEKAVHFVLARQAEEGAWLALPETFSQPHVKDATWPRVYYTSLALLLLSSTKVPPTPVPRPVITPTPK